MEENNKKQDSECTCTDDAPCTCHSNKWAGLKWLVAGVVVGIIGMIIFRK